MEEDKPESTPESQGSPQDSSPPPPPLPEENHTEEEQKTGEKRPLEDDANTPDEALQEEGEVPADPPKENKITPLINKNQDKIREPKLKKRKWGGKINTSEEDSIVISSDSLKSLIAESETPQPLAAAPCEEEATPSAAPAEEAAVSSEAVETPRHYLPEPARPQPESHQPPRVRTLPEVLPKRDELLVNSDPKSPARNPTSAILSIHNLVRPFTLGQLKEMLGRLGTLLDQGFWIDRIKSKCFVTYSSEEEAQKAREVLHHSRWPASNPKTLVVDFSNKEELEHHIRLTEPHRLPPPAPAAPSPKRSSPSPPKIPAERESNSKPVLREKPLREWDIGKVLQEPSPPTKPKQNKDKKGDHTETQLLDNLFRKTKATPFVYWLPLSEEEATKKEAERKAEAGTERRRWAPNDDHPPPRMREERHYRDGLSSRSPRRC